MSILPPALNHVIDALRNLPGVGPRSAERYAYYLLRSSPKKALQIADSLQNLHQDTGYCKKTFALIEKGKEFSDLYTNPSRDKTTVAVVAEPFDVVALENTNTFKGTYHVLGGLISPIDGISSDELTIKQLLQRIDDDDVKELILATNATVEGESTALFIQKQLKDSGVLITRLAQGLPIGVDLEYADQITLSRALEGRRSI